MNRCKRFLLVLTITVSFSITIALPTKTDTEISHTISAGRYGLVSCNSLELHKYGSFNTTVKRKIGQKVTAEVSANVEHIVEVDVERTKNSVEDNRVRSERFFLSNASVTYGWKYLLIKGGVTSRFEIYSQNRNNKGGWFILPSANIFVGNRRKLYFSGSFLDGAFPAPFSIVKGYFGFFPTDFMEVQTGLGVNLESVEYLFGAFKLNLTPEFSLFVAGSLFRKEEDMNLSNRIGSSAGFTVKF